ncbi:MAG: hypothetical protein JHD16_07730 [Solirubrobacteraceae bacterium]|nr:hypothetical protein [Solirubrobacteraceae bacterium]
MAFHLEIREQVVGLRAPLVASWGVLDRRTLFLVELHGSDGPVGRGEAAPMEAYDGVSDDACRAALRRLAAELEQVDETEPGHVILDRLTGVTPVQQALAAIDLAMWDRGARQAGKAVAPLLASEALDSIAVHKTIGGVTADEAGRIAAEAAAAGFSAFKVKVGLGLEGDVARVAAVREAAGPDARIKVDANGAWSVSEALDALDRLLARPLRVAAVEEPVSGSDAWPHLRAAVNAARFEVELCVDETADREPGVLSRGPDVVEVKLARTGGIGPLLVKAALARLAGVHVALASTFDGPLGIAAAVHAAAALKIERPLGLATLDALDLDDAPELAELAARLQPVNGRIAVPAGPGLL